MDKQKIIENAEKRISHCIKELDNAANQIFLEMKENSRTLGELRMNISTGNLNMNFSNERKFDLNFEEVQVIIFEKLKANFHEELNSIEI